MDNNSSRCILAQETTGIGDDRPSIKATPTRTAISPYSLFVRPTTPFSQMPTHGIFAPASWGEGTEDGLVSNLGPRERTRQEVRWEIIASKERYVCLPTSSPIYLHSLPVSYISKPPLGCAELYRYAYHHRPHSKVPTNKETHRGVQYCTPTSG